MDKAVYSYLCGFLYKLWPFEPCQILLFTTLAKTLNNYSHNTSQFLRKYCSVTRVIVQCFFEEVSNFVIIWLLIIYIKKCFYKNKICNEFSVLMVRFAYSTFFCVEKRRIRFVWEGRMECGQRMEFWENKSKKF